MRISNTSSPIVIPTSETTSNPTHPPAPGGLEVLRGSPAPGNTTQSDSFWDNVVNGFKALLGQGKNGSVNGNESKQLKESEKDAQSSASPTTTPTATPTPTP